MKWCRDIIAVIVSVAGLFLMILGAVGVLNGNAAIVGSVLLAGGLVFGGLNALGDKLDRMENRAGQKQA